MIKENYTRRPKKPFDNYKENFNHKTIRSHSRPTEGKLYSHGGDWVDEREKSTIKIVKLGFLVVILIGVIYVFVVNPTISSIRRKNFEKTHFTELYNNNRIIFDELITLYESLQSIYTMKFRDNGDLFFVIKSSDFLYKGNFQGGDNVVNLGGSWDTNYQQFRIENTTLFVDRVDKRYYVLNNWAIIYNGTTKDTVNNERVFPLLGWDLQTSTKYPSDLRKIGLTEFFKDEKGNLHLTLKQNEFGTYEIMTSQKILKIKEATTNGEISKNIFWIRRR